MPSRQQFFRICRCLTLLLLSVSGCLDQQPVPEPEAPELLPVQQVEQLPQEPVHFGEDSLRSPLLETMRQQIERGETEETRDVTQALTKQLADADVIMAEARRSNKNAIQQANRQVRMGAARLSPNILLITVDRLGINDLSCAGQTRWETTRLDEFAAAGIRFTQHYSGGLDLATSEAALMTGRFATSETLSQSNTKLPRVLWNAGYLTSLIGDWNASASPASLGYESSSGWGVATPSEFPDWAELNGKKVSIEDNQAGQQKVSKEAFLLSEVRSFLRDARRRPNQFFLQVSLRPFSESGSKPLSAEEYAARVVAIDRACGKILDSLEESGLTGRTCVVFTALAGPAPSRSSLVRETGSTNAFSHSEVGWQEGNLRVPFLVRWPTKIPTQTVSEEVSGHWDLLPSLAQLATVSRPIGTVDGRSLVQVWKEQRPLERRRVLWKSPTNGALQVVRFQNWKAVKPNSEGFQLFDLTKAPAEDRNVASEHKDVLELITK